MARAQDPRERRLGLLQATAVGVGAIVGGGILALAGTAFATTGPSAILAFALNGLIALLTALTFAEMASKFPESGGTYTYARKVLSVQAAFTVGWVVWFASILAAVLYAMGFAHFSLIMFRELWEAAGKSPLAWADEANSVRQVAGITAVLVSLWLARSRSAPGSWTNVGKLLIFALLLAGGAWAFIKQPLGDSSAALRPFFSNGMPGLLQAMGYSFIALQGFDLIAAVGGEVREPHKNLPRAMVGSLGIALAIYLPLLFFVSTVGLPAGENIATAATADAEGILSGAGLRFLGPFGYWLVIIAAILSMFTALQANLFAASRIAHSMARDGTLPKYFARLNSKHSNPANASYVTAILVIVLLFFLADVGSAGAAASLIFLVTFSLAHATSVLVRQRSTLRPPPYRTPWFPLVPVVGGLACVSLAAYQGHSVPAAGTIVLVWMGVGAVLFLLLFARRARVRDALSAAIEPELVTLRGHAPLVLVPIAHPEHAEMLVSLANALVPASVGRVMLQMVVVAPADWDPEQDKAPLERMQELLPQLIQASAKVGIRAETLTTIARDPMADIARVTRLHRCDSVVLGLSKIVESEQGTPLELLLGTLDADVVVLRAPDHWKLSEAKRVLVLVGGGTGHESLLARLLGSLSRSMIRDATFLRVVPPTTTPKERRRIQREVHQLARDIAPETGHGEIIASADPVWAVAKCAGEFDLVLIGAHRVGRHKMVFGHFTRGLAQLTESPLIVMSRRG